MVDKYNKYYNRDYFKFRKGNDPKRQKSFLIEKKLINKYISSGNLLDVGCSTGEFIESLQWEGKVYGMEISKLAINLAKKKEIKFNKSLFNSKNYFDLIVFRGTIQHIDTPFLYMKLAYKALKPGGYIWFYAPNANSIYYKIWNTLPFLDPKINFYIPSDITLVNSLENFGFKLIEVNYPYIGTPYVSLIKDHFRFLLKLFGVNTSFPFWKNQVSIVCQKPNE